MGRAVIAETNRKPSEAVATNDADFEAMAIFANGNNRGQSACDEIAVLDRLVCRFKHLPRFQRHRFEHWLKQSEVVRRHRRQEPVLLVNSGIRGEALSHVAMGKSTP